MTFIDIGGAYPDNAFAAVIFASDRAKFPHGFQDDLGPVLVEHHLAADQLKTN